MSDEQNRVCVHLMNEMAIITEDGRHTITLTADGTLEVKDAQKGIVGLFAGGFWRSAYMLNPHPTRETA